MKSLKWHLFAIGLILVGLSSYAWARTPASASPRASAQNPVSASPSPQRVAPPPESLRSAKLLQSVAVGDFNGDGIMDFAVADFLSDNILVMLGDGQGHYRLAATLPAGSGPRSIVAGDFNHDGMIDLATANFFSGDVSIFFGHGDGTFADPYSIHLAPGLSSLGAADFSSDGSLDLVAANFLSGALTVLKGAPDGSFVVEATLGAAPAASLVYVQDFNGNGHQDVIAVDASEKQVWLFAGNGHGGFQPGQSIDPQVAASRFATQPPVTATTAALSQLPAIAKATGDGQLAYPGSVLPAALVAVVAGPGGGAVPPKSMFFSSLYGGASVMGSTSGAANDQGQVSAQVALSALPGINFVATSAPGGAAAAFGAASVLRPADFFNQVESALFPSPQTPASLPGKQLLDKAQDQLNKNDVVGAVVTLQNSLALLAQGESQPAEPAVPGAPIDLLKRLLNQVMLFGLGLGDFQGTISCGQTVSGTLATSQQDYYTFSANASEVITFAARETSNGYLNACADLYLYPSGTTKIASACNGVSVPVTITTTSTYLFIVHASDYATTGNYNLGLQFLTGRCAGTTGCGQIKTGTLVATQQDAYSFSANAGEVITFPSVETNNGYLAACTDLYNASGTKIGGNPCNKVNTPFTIPTTGTYLFVVHASDYATAGNYNLGLQFLTGRCAGTTGCGQIQSGKLAATQQDAYGFSANAGEVITFPSMQTNNGYLAACTDLYNTSGTKIGGNPCNGVNAAFTVPTTGNYLFVVHASDYATTGNYNLGLQFLTGRCAGSTSCGQIKSGTLATTQQDVYSFSANAGEVISFPSIETSNGYLAACTDLYNTAGTKIGGNPCNKVNAPFTVPTTGNYLFVVHASDYATAGNYNLGLQFLTGRCAGSTTCGQIKSGKLATTQQDVYGFSANAGEVITFPSMQTNNGYLAACTDLYNTSGTKIGGNPCNGVNAAFTVPTTGNYLFVVHASDYATTGNYNLGLQFLTGRCAGSTSCGQIKSGTLATTQQDVYSFSANAGEVISFPSMETSNGYLAACTDLYNTSGAKIGGNPCNKVNAPFTVPTTGNYLFVVHASDYATTGNYNLDLQFLTGRCASGTGCGQTNSGTLVAAQQNAYTFSAQSGEVVTLDSVETNNGYLGACADLYNAAGVKIASDPCNGLSAPFTLPATGGYTFIVHASDYATSGAYNANWQFTTGCPGCSVSPPSLSFATQLVGTTSTAQSATISNKGLAPLTISNVGTSANFGETNNCGGVVAAGGSCTISVTFAPTATGSLTGSLTVTDDASGTPATVSLAGTGVNPGVGLSLTSVPFGYQLVNTPSVAKKVTLTAEGTVNVNITSFTITGTNATDFAASTCPASMAPGAKCIISLTYTPSILGAEKASLVVTDNAYNSPQTVALSGTGVLPVELSPTSLAFGNLAEGDTSTAKTITMTNYQKVELPEISVGITGTTDYTQTNTCGTSLGAGKKCTITVTFKPTIIGADNATLSVSDSASNSPQTAPLTGTGVAPVTVLPTPLAFGNVVEGNSAEKTITVTNAQNVELTGISVGISGSADYTQTNTCGTSIAAGKTCTITVTFKPSIIGTDDATLSVSDSAVTSPQTTALTGTGTAPVTLTPTSATYATQKVGTTSAAKVFTLTSYLTATVSSIAISTTGDFAVSSTTCTTTLTTKAKCTIDVVFKPTETGTRTGSLSVSDSAANSPQTSTLKGTGD
jgi:hypothetical protein